MQRLRTLIRAGQPVLAVLLLGLLVLATLSAAGGAVASHLADSMTITVRAAEHGAGAGAPGDSGPQLAVVKTFADARIVGGVQHAINSVPVDSIVPLSDDPWCPSVLGPLRVYYSYDFAFRWHGVPTQDATFDSYCVAWVIHTIGWPNWLVRRNTSVLMVDIVRLTGVPAPWSPQPPSGLLVGPG
jgi:hypothetical protein